MSTAARWPALLAFEIRYQGWRFTFLATVLLLVIMPLITVATAFGPQADAVNGAFIVTETMGLISLIAVFALPMLCVHAALRDDEHGMRALVESRPVSRLTVLTVRFAGVLLLMLTSLALSTVVLAVLPSVMPVPADRLTTFRTEPYLRAFLLLTVPNALWCTALLFAVAAATRSTLATFVASIGIYAGYMVTAMMVDSPIMAGTRPPTPELLARAALLDPFGLSAFFEQTRYLTPVERQSHALALTGHLWQNRALMLLFTMLCLTPLPWLDTRMARLGGGAHSRWPRFVRRLFGARSSIDDALVDPAIDRTIGSSATLRVVPPSTDTAMSWRQTTGAVMRLETRLLLRSWPLLALLVMWVVVIAIEADGQLKSGEYGARVMASSAQLADAVPIALQLLGTLCVLYFGTDVFARERLLHVDGIRDATPAASGAMLTGKVVALLTVPLLLTLTGYGTTVVMHLVAGGLPIEWRVLGAHVVTSMLPLVIATGMTAALQLLIGNRWVAMMLGLIVLLVGAQGQSLGNAIGLAHPLWRFGSTPRLIWSDLSGYGPTFTSWLAFEGTWLLGTLVLLGCAAAFWPRGELLPFLQRLRHAPRLLQQSLSPRARTALAAGTVFYAATLVGMAWQTTVHTPFVSQGAAIERRLNYERTYRRLAEVAQPGFTHMALHVQLEPEHARAVVRGRLHVVNQSGATIDTLWLLFPTALSQVTVGPDADTLAGSLVDAPSPALTERGRQTAAHLVRVDTTHGVHVLALATPLAPGDSMPLAIALTVDRGGIRAEGNAIDVVGNGTLLHSSDFLPRFGYAPGRELRDSVQRVQHGLSTPATPLLLTAASEDSLRADVQAHGQSPAWFTADVRIVTDADQVAQGPGMLVDSTRSATTSTWHYRTTRPTSAALVITSGRYAVQRATVQTARGATPVEVWYNPRHAAPATRLLRIATLSLPELEREFGPYPHDVLRLVEVPAGHRFGAYAMPGNIYLTETRGLLTDAREGDVDLLLRRIGHEIAHQWWGHAVNPLDIEGRLLVVETMAKYAEQILLERVQGRERLVDMLAFDHDRYMRSRSASEATLITMIDEPELYYSKGTLAMHTLRHALGDSVVREVLRHVIATESGPRGTSSAQQLYRHLRDAAGDAAVNATINATDPDAQRLVNEWLTQRVVYDLVADTATFTTDDMHTRRDSGSGNGTHIVAHFSAQRELTDERGVHVTPAHGESFLVGLRDATGAQHLLSVRAQQGVVAIDTLVPWPVKSVEIDPLLYVLDRDRSNNRITAPEAPAASSGRQTALAACCSPVVAHRP